MTGLHPTKTPDKGRKDRLLRGFLQDMAGFSSRNLCVSWILRRKTSFPPFLPYPKATSILERKLPAPCSSTLGQIEPLKIR